MYKPLVQRLLICVYYVVWRTTKQRNMNNKYEIFINIINFFMRVQYMDNKVVINHAYDVAGVFILTKIIRINSTDSLNLINNL